MVRIPKDAATLQHGSSTQLALAVMRSTEAARVRFRQILERDRRPCLHSKAPFLTLHDNEQPTTLPSAKEAVHITARQLKDCSSTSTELLAAGMGNERKPRRCSRSRSRSCSTKDSKDRDACWLAVMCNANSRKLNSQCHSVATLLREHDYRHRGPCPCCCHVTQVTWRARNMQHPIIRPESSLEALYFGHALSMWGFTPCVHRRRKF